MRALSVRFGSDHPQVVAAERELAGPDYPNWIGYLYDWARELHGRSGVGMSGPAPVTFETIAHWSALTGARPDATEIEGLLVLDAVLMERHMPEEAQT